MTESKFFTHNEYSGFHLFNESGIAIPVDSADLESAALSIEKNEDCSFHLVEVVFVDSDEIIRINKEHLEHDYVTDIITFRYDEATDNHGIEGTLYCCASQIKEQARDFNQQEKTEFKRIIIHGLLHLVGYDDTSPEAQREMSAKEDYFLNHM